MGQKLSCFSKQKKEPKTKSTKSAPKTLKTKKKNEKEIVPQAIQTVETTVHQTTDHALNHAAPDIKAELVRPKVKLILCKPAPDKIKLPTVVPVQTEGKITPTLDESKFKKNTSLSTNVMNVAQPVDSEVQKLVESGARPATWADLYWNLIGSRKLSTDLEKARALFSWLCLIPKDRDAFITYEELEEAVKNNVPHAAEAIKAKSKKLNLDSPEVVVNDLAKGESAYLKALDALCRYAGIPCCTIKGLAKGVDYTVGMKLPDDKLTTASVAVPPVERIQHAWNAAYIDGKWGLFDSMWAAERLAMGTNSRLSQLSQIDRLEYERDMFYFNADPSIFIQSHFPIEEDWQLLKPAMSIKDFQDGVLLKPAFFTHGLSLTSHKEGVIPVENKLIVKLSIPPALIDTLLFTFNLKYDGSDEIFEGANLSRFGMHEISPKESVVTFSFRFPKPGGYKLTMYARKVGDPLFTDVCEYRVEAKGSDSTSQSTSPTAISIAPFPPTSQSQFGPTERVAELKVRTVTSDVDAIRKCTDGVFEIRFTTTDPSVKLPQLTARLKSLLHDAGMLIDCILVRNVEAPLPTTLSSVRTSGSMNVVSGPPVPMCVITAYLPSAGEYALEVYGAPADADEKTSYFLCWQLLIDSDCGFKLSTPVRKHLSTINLGPRDSAWTKLGLKTISHPDPLIHVPTKGVAGMHKTRSKTELMQEFVKKAAKFDLERQGFTQPDSSAKELAVRDSNAVDAYEVEDKSSERQACDLKIVFGKPASSKLCIVGQLVDINETKEEDCTAYLLQQIDDTDDSGMQPSDIERVTYLIRIPKADHFYKFYLYSAVMDGDPTISLPLVYTYLLEAPKRIMSIEVPYVGVKYGAFPEKLEKQEQQQQQAANQ